MNENNRYRFAVLGGDKRQVVVAREIADRGHTVRCVGDGDMISRLSVCEICTSVDKAMEGADFALLPLPVSRDNLNLELGSEKMALCDIVRLAKKNGTMLLGGIVPEELKRVCSAMDVEIVDYYKSESLQQKNALPSAEGALMVAMEHTDITVSGMKALVSGYGRIGKLLSSMLRSLGARVTVAARRDEVLCDISMSGFKAIKIQGEAFAEAASDCDVIFNTVPFNIFNESVLKKFKGHPLYIEIASSPGGINAKEAREAGVEVVYAPSLPGKYSPVSAGKYVFETINEILTERGINI